VTSGTLIPGDTGSPDSVLHREPGFPGDSGNPEFRVTQETWSPPGFLQPGHYSSLPTPIFQPIATQGMYNFRFTILINTNNTSNY